MSIGAAGGGAALGLQDVLSQLLREQIAKQQADEAAQRHEIAQQEIGLRSRGLEQDQQRIGLEGQRVGFEGRRVGVAERGQDLEETAYREAAPQRAVRTRLDTAQAADIEGRPEREQRGMAHDVFMAGLGNKFRMKEIGAQGANQADVARIYGQNRGMLTGSQKVTASRGLLKDYQAAVKPARELERQLTIMDEGLKAAKAGNLNAGSQAVLVTFQKILDPASVVRESEYARTPEGLSVLQRLEGLGPRIIQGGPGVPVAQLEEFYSLAKNITDAMSREAEGKTADYRAIAEANGLDLDFGKAGAPPSPTPAPTAGGPKVGDEKTFPNGTKGRFDGQGWVKVGG